MTLLNSLVLLPDGHVEETFVEDAPAQASNIVGGNVRIVRLTSDCVMAVNAATKRGNQAYNTSATMLARRTNAFGADDWITGPVLIVGTTTGEDFTNIPMDMRISIRLMQAKAGDRFIP